MTNVVLTKQAAAKRLLEAAARMVNSSADRLAAHVVASSALNMLRELISQRGPGYITLSIREALYSAALARLDGRPTGLPSDPELEQILDQVAAGIAAGAVAGAFDINISGGPNERQALDAILRPFNFLKHAQRDPLATLDEGDVRPEDALLHAVGAFAFLFPSEGLSPEVIEFAKRGGIL